MVTQGWGVDKGGLGVTVSENGISFMEDKYVLKLDNGDGCTNSKNLHNLCEIQRGSSYYITYR